MGVSHPRDEAEKRLRRRGAMSVEQGSVEDVRISLVMATFDRVDPLARFLKALAVQSHSNVELILVDQNSDARLASVLRTHANDMTVIHLKSGRGACRARNVGLQAVTGQVIAFPDDDCWYGPGLLEQVADALRAHAGLDGIVGRPIEADGRTAGVSHTTTGLITKYNVWRRGIASTMFLRRSVVDVVGQWDVRIGPGSARGLGASDETDYLIRALEHGCRLQYDPGIAVFHPDPAEYDARSGRRRGYSYGRSMGAVLRKHSYPMWFRAYACARPLGGSMLWLLRGRRQRAMFHWSVLQGRVHGLIRPMES